MKPHVDLIAFDQLYQDGGDNFIHLHAGHINIELDSQVLQADFAKAFELVYQIGGELGVDIVDRLGLVFLAIDVGHGVFPHIIEDALRDLFKSFIQFYAFLFR